MAQSADLSTDIASPGSNYSVTGYHSGQLGLQALKTRMWRTRPRQLRRTRQLRRAKQPRRSKLTIFANIIRQGFVSSRVIAQSTMTMIFANPSPPMIKKFMI